MKNKALYVSAAVLIALNTAVYAQTDVPRAVERSSDSVVEINVSTPFGQQTINGIVIGKKSDYVITDYDTISNSEGSITAVYGESSVNAAVSSYDEAADIAVLRLDEKIKGTRPVHLLKELNEGAEVYVVNRYAALDPSKIVKGEFLEKAELSLGGAGKTDVYVINAQIDRASDKALLADKRGNLAGVCLYDGNTAQNKAIPPELIRSLGVDYKKASILYMIAPFIAAILFLSAAAAITFAIIRKRKREAPVIELTGGELSGKTIPLGRESITIGRDAKACQVVITDDPEVSRCHCSVKYEKSKGMFVVTDLSSTHGTYMNDGIKLEPNVPRRAQAETIFRLGDGRTAFRVKYGDL